MLSLRSYFLQGFHGALYRFSHILCANRTRHKNGAAEAAPFV